MSEILKVRKAKFGYGKNVVISEIDFAVEEGDFLCVVGPNGSGKTTLIAGILGLLKPLGGEVILDGFSPKQIGYIPQENLIDVNFPATVFEIVLTGTLNEGYNVYNSEVRGKAEAVLKTVGILKLKDKSFDELSGGERQKVLISRALVASKKMLILDEPSNNLDQKSKIWLYEFLQKLNKDDGMTIMMVTHDLDHGNLIGNKILSLRDNEIFFGPTEEFVMRVHNE